MISKKELHNAMIRTINHLDKTTPDNDHNVHGDAVRTLERLALELGFSPKMEWWKD